MARNNEFKKVDVLGLDYDNVTMYEMVQRIYSYFEKKQQDNMFIVTANPEITLYARQHPMYRQIINSADYVVPDGTGIVMGAKILGRPLKERVPGIELMEACIEVANKRQQRVFLLGSEDHVVRLAKKKLQQKYKHVRFAHHHGYIDMDDKALVQRIKDYNPDYLFVGMGYPKQERWIKRYKSEFDHTLMMGVGGSLEVLSGLKKRAPQFFIKFNLEWVYRLLIDWKRIGRVKSVPIFLWRVITQKSKENRRKQSNASSRK